MKPDKKLYRSRTVKSLAGVCGGLADYFGIDVTIIRLIWAVAAVAYGTGLLAYIVAAIIIPLEPEEI
ncbi:MAG TPA: PspC domain-containing protein [Firmicutes bacterium]|jgi:phage shock protein C|nr:PspC domain-containing protein [Bacillota bacterium]